MNSQFSVFAFLSQRVLATEAQPLFSCCTYFSNCECQSESLLVYCNVKHLLLIQISSLQFFGRQCAVRRCVCVIYTATHIHNPMNERYLSDVLRIGSNIILFDGNITRERSSCVKLCQLFSPVRDIHAMEEKIPTVLHSFLLRCFRVVFHANNFIKWPLRSAIGITCKINYEKS